MTSIYNSAICANCGRDKQLVAEARSPGADLVPPVVPYCWECIAHPCPDYGPDEPTCRLPRAFESASMAYLTWCPRHQAEHARCACGQAKEPWQPTCTPCRERAQAQAAAAQVRAWRRDGSLCPSCRKRQVAALHRHCAVCLRQRGINPLRAGAWTGAVRAILGGACSLPPVEIARQERAMLARAAARGRAKDLKRKLKQAARKRKAALVASKRKRAPNRNAPPVPAPPARIERRRPPPLRNKRRPRPGQERWKPSHWTG